MADQGDRVLLHVWLPATRRSYDVWVPSDMSVHEAAVLTGSILAGREPGRYVDRGDVAFMDSGTGRLLNPAASVSSAGLVDGSQVMLV